MKKLVIGIILSISFSNIAIADCSGVKITKQWSITSNYDNSHHCFFRIKNTSNEMKLITVEVTSSINDAETESYEMKVGSGNLEEGKLNMGYDYEHNATCSSKVTSCE